MNYMHVHVVKFHKKEDVFASKANLRNSSTGIMDERIDFRFKFCRGLQIELLIPFKNILRNDAKERQQFLSILHRKRIV